MDEVAEALGTMAEGALLGRAVERKTGEDNGHTHESACLNCGTRLVGPHCHACGQHAHVHRTLGAFFHDLLHGVFHFEGKTWHTLPLLAWRPGELTRRYIAGERARFVSPMGLFLFSVFLMFAVFQIVGIGAPTEFENDAVATADGSAARLEALREAREDMGDDNPAAAVIDSQIAALEKSAQAPADEAGSNAGAEIKSKDGKRSASKTGWAFLDHGIEKWRANPGLMAYKLQANSYKFSWLLIPLSIPFVWLIFAWRRRYGPYDHAVFVTYSLCFMSLLFIALAVLGQIPGSGSWLVLAAMLIPPAHIYRQLRGAYALSRFSAIWRMMALSVFILIVLLLFVSALLALGALG